MDIKKAENIKSQKEAIQFAIAWQAWGSNQRMSMGELIRWQNALKTVASKFRLVRQFRENGII